MKKQKSTEAQLRAAANYRARMKERGAKNWPGDMITSESAELLTRVAQKYGVTKSEAIIKGLRLLDYSTE